MNQRRSNLRIAIGLLSIIVMTLAIGCSSSAQCSTELTDGTATYKGVARGKKGQVGLDRDAMRDACMQRCADTKAAIIDACVSHCVVDIESKKLGAKTSCSDR